MSKPKTKIVNGPRTWEIIGEMTKGLIAADPPADSVENITQTDLTVVGVEHDPWEQRVNGQPVLLG